MGLMTLQNFQDDLKEALGRPTVDSNRLNRWINAALQEVGYAFEFPEFQKTASIVTVQGTRSYAMPIDFRAVHESGVRLTSPQNRFGGILQAETRTEYKRGDRYPTTSAQGAVGKYHMFGKQIWVRPAPDSNNMTIEFDYWAKITPLVNPADVTPLDGDWDDAVFRGALYRGHLNYGEHDRMINVFNLYLAGIRSRVMAEDLQEFPEGGIDVIQNSFDAYRR